MKRRGSRVLDAFEKMEVYPETKEFGEVRRKMIMDSTMCDVFLTGTNAITEDGRLVNVDSMGNRVAGMFWGHPATVIAVGRNKIVKNLDEAFHRVRNLIAPTHSKLKAEIGGFQRGVPCYVTGKCSDCRAADRICNVFTIIEGKPAQTDMKVIIVDEDLGLSYDESWPSERIAKILEGYRKFVCSPPRK